MKRTSILVADDHSMMCAGLRKILEPEFEVIACVNDGLSLVKTALELKPDIVLVDVGMPLLNGLDAGRELRRLAPRIKLIFLTMLTDSEIAIQALRMGASGYLLKNAQGDELLGAIRGALRGTSYVAPQIREAMNEMFIRDPRSLDRPRHLSDRQREVLQMLAEGRSMQEVANSLEISYRTVRFHKQRIMEELGLKTNSELVQYAIKHGMIVPL